MSGIKPAEMVALMSAGDTACRSPIAGAMVL